MKNENLDDKRTKTRAARIGRILLPLTARTVALAAILEAIFLEIYLLLDTIEVSKVILTLLHKICCVISHSY